MEGIRTYLLQITAAAMLCGIVTGILGKKGLLGTTVKLIAGVIMTLAVVSPWLDLRIDNFDSFLDGISLDASAAVAEGEISAANTMKTIIKERTQAYILDKAETLGTQVAVDVYLTDDAVPVPTGVRVSGKYSPYAKSVLSAYIADDLGINLEDQIWTQQP